MSIIDTFDRDGIEIISPYQTIEKIENFPETVVSVFSQRIADLVLKTMPAEKISSVSGGRIVPIYKIRYKDLDMGFYHTLLGGAASAGLLEEIFAKGAKRLLFFGSCGSLDKKLQADTSLFRFRHIEMREQAIITRKQAIILT